MYYKMPDFYKVESPTLADLGEGPGGDRCPRPLNVLEIAHFL